MKQFAQFKMASTKKKRTTSKSLNHRFHARQLDDDSGNTRAAEARATQLRREQVHKAALDNMAGEAVSALFASMADRAKDKDKAGNDAAQDDNGKPERGGGGSGDGRGASGHGTAKGRAADGKSEQEKRLEKRGSVNQDGEEEYGPRGGEGLDSGNQQGEGWGEEKYGGVETRLETGNAVDGAVVVLDDVAPPPSSHNSSIRDYDAEVARSVVTSENASKLFVCRLLDCQSTSNIQDGHGDRSTKTEPDGLVKQPPGYAFDIRQHHSCRREQCAGG